MLAIDPSSPFTGGAILGDRVRMQDHAIDAGVFIRSMATRGHLGGLALATPEAVRVLDAAGRRGCSSRPSASARSRSRSPARPTPPSWWSTRAGATRVQANKAGLMEIADVFVINKADRPGRRRDPPRPRADARPVATCGELAPADRPHGRARTARASTSCGTPSLDHRAHAESSRAAGAAPAAPRLARGAARDRGRPPRRTGPRAVPRRPLRRARAGGARPRPRPVGRGRRAARAASAPDRVRGGRYGVLASWLR